MVCAKNCQMWENAMQNCRWIYIARIYIICKNQCSKTQPRRQITRGVPGERVGADVIQTYSAKLLGLINTQSNSVRIGQNTRATSQNSGYSAKLLRFNVFELKYYVFVWTLKFLELLWSCLNFELYEFKILCLCQTYNFETRTFLYKKFQSEYSLHKRITPYKVVDHSSTT